MTEQQDLYAILGVDKGASKEEIKMAYKRAALYKHPDKGGDPAEFVAIANAYKILSKSESRAAYDRGEVYKKPITIEEEATTIILSMFDDGLEDPKTFTIKNIINSIKSGIHKLNLKLSKQEGKIENLEKFILRIKLDNKSHIYNVTNSKIESLNYEIEKTKHDLDIGELIISMLDSYSIDEISKEGISLDQITVGSHHIPTT